MSVPKLYLYHQLPLELPVYCGSIESESVEMLIDSTLELQRRYNINIEKREWLALINDETAYVLIGNYIYTTKECEICND